MSKKELKDYSKWFLGIIAQRLDELTQAVKKTPSFEDWKPDFTPASLDLLGNWLAMQVETRPRTIDEIQEIESRLVKPIEVSKEELTDRTFSVAMDVGMYLSKVLLATYPSLQWNQSFGNKNSVNYGQPVITGFGITEFNPVHILVTLSYGLANKKKTGARLQEIFDIWSKMVKANA